MLVSVTFGAPAVLMWAQQYKQYDFFVFFLIWGITDIISKRDPWTLGRCDTAWVRRRWQGHMNILVDLDVVISVQKTAGKAQKLETVTQKCLSSFSSLLPKIADDCANYSKNPRCVFIPAAKSLCSVLRRSHPQVVSFHGSDWLSRVSVELPFLGRLRSQSPQVRAPVTFLIQS